MTQEQNPSTPEADDVDHSDDLAAVRSEAKQRRLALRAAEAERDSLRAWREERERADVEAVVAEKLKDPSDLWMATSLDVMRGEDGTIDMEKVTGEIGRVLAEKRHWAKDQPKPEVPDLHQGPRRTVEPAGPSFGQALRGARQ